MRHPVSKFHDYRHYLLLRSCVHMEFTLYTYFLEALEVLVTVAHGERGSVVE
jgi:hypothetical protein